MAQLWQDLRFAARLLVKDRTFTLAAVLALALGIGANTAVFTLVNAILLRNLPFEEADRIMWVGTRDARGRDRAASFQDFYDWRQTTRSIPDLAVVTGGAMHIGDEDRATELYSGTYVSPEAFHVTGVQPILGRAITADDNRPEAPPVVVLGHRIWTERYGSDPSILGRTIRITGRIATVIGVFPEGMKFPFNSELWMPVAQMSVARRTEGREIRNHVIVGRLAPGVTIGEARAEFSGIGANLAREYPATNKDVVPTVTPFVDQIVGRDVRLMFWSLMGAVAFVLLVACANVANLLLGRAASRAREMAVRVSLGATRGRIVRQLLAESVLLAVISGVVGLGIAVAGVRWFAASTADMGIPYWMAFTLEPRVLAFCAIVCVATGIVFGLAPALQLSKAGVNDVLKEGGRSGGGSVRVNRWTGALVVTELTLTLVLLSGAGLMLRSFIALYRLDIGVNPANMMVLDLQLFNAAYPSAEKRADFMRRADARLGAVPAVGAITTASNIPYGGGLPLQLTVDGRALAGDRPPTVTLVTVGPRYFDVLGLRLLRGRQFEETDGEAGRENAIINQRFASLHFPGEDPIGKRISLVPEGPPSNAPPSWLTIVGVSPTVRQSSFQQPEPDAVVYTPYLGSPHAPRYATIISRTPGEAGRITPLIREEMRLLDPDVPLFNIRTLDNHLSQTRFWSRSFASLFGIFAGIALLLAAVGLYAVTAYSVTQRTQEIGVRMALGAQPGQIRWLILRRGLVQLFIGIVLGLAGALSVGRLLQSQLIQIKPWDPVTFASIVAVLVAVAVVACLWPARRATRLHPAIALRYE